MDKVKCIFKSNNDCCNIYSCTCDYSNNCESNTDCPIKRLQEENERLKEEIKQYKKYKFLFEKAKEFKEQTDKWASKCLAENEDLKDTIKRTVCQAECFRYKQANTYKQAIQEIKEIAEEGSKSVFADEDCDKILDKINKVIGDNNNNG